MTRAHRRMLLEVAVVVAAAWALGAIFAALVMALALA